MLTRQQTVEKPNQKPFTAWRRLAAWRQEYQGRAGKAANRKRASCQAYKSWLAAPPQPTPPSASHNKGDRKKNVPPLRFLRWFVCPSLSFFSLPKLRDCLLQTAVSSRPLPLIPLPPPQCIFESRHTPLPFLPTRPSHYCWLGVVSVLFLT